MQFETNKEKGNMGVAMAIAYFTSKGYTVSIPLNDTQDYDLVIEKDGIFQSVQCKATNSKAPNPDGYNLSLKSCGGTKGKTYKTLIDTDIDLLFALRGDGIMYVIPKNDIKNISNITLTTKRSQYANKNTLNSSEYIVTF